MPPLPLPLPLPLPPPPDAPASNPAEHLQERAARAVVAAPSGLR
jgi:hypothetical protein